MIGIVSTKLMHVQVVLIAVLSCMTRARPATSAQHIFHHVEDRNTDHDANARLYEAAANKRSLVRRELVRDTEKQNESVRSTATYQDLLKVYMTHWAGCNVSAPVRTKTREYFFNIFDRAVWGKEAKSGTGSTLSAAKPFADFLIKFIKRNHVKSITEVSCGHWPSGWQSQITWPAIQYHGVDIVDEIVKANRALLDKRQDNFGFLYAEFLTGDMACDSLPTADLLLVKDTLQHLSFNYIKQFLAKNVFGKDNSKRHKFVMFVDDMLLGVEENIDIENGGQRHLEMSGYPFRLAVRPAFAWKAADMKKIVEVLDIDKASYLDPSDVAKVSEVRSDVYDYLS
mmetsp:Transcript_158885/g.281667  ORF Transcript_158885/g.281667 Transcript_158885/m.281667 type:complete len:341 (-) Transcript_158885:16-1038(-)